MADAPSTGTGLDKEIAGQPAWIWLVGVGAVIVGYIILKHRSAAGATSGTTGNTGGGGTSTSSFTDTIREWQSSPRKQPKPRPGPKPPPHPHHKHHHKHDDDDKKHHHRKHHGG